MGLTDGYVDVGLTRPEDIVEQLQWEKYERAMARHRRRVRARQRARCEARFGCAGCSLCGAAKPGVVWSRRRRRRGARGSEGLNPTRRRATRWRQVPVPSSEMVEVKRPDDSRRDEKAGEPARRWQRESASEEDKEDPGAGAPGRARLRKEQAADRSRRIVQSAAFQFFG